MDLNVVILAAGHGTRMRSSLPKVLHTIAGRPMLWHIVNTAMACKAQQICVVYGHGGKQVKAALHDKPITWIEQTERLGTGHALMQALPAIENHHHVLVLPGDVPMISEKTIQQLQQRTPADAIGWLTAHVPDPTGFGRIIRDDDGNPQAIVEEKDATDLQRTITEINTGICLVPAHYLKQWLPELKSNNAQNEFYLTDIFSTAISQGINTVTVSPDSLVDIQGVNDRTQQAKLERAYQKRQANQLLLQGVSLLSPERFDLRGELTVGTDVTIDINAIIEGNVTIGSHTYIGPQVCLKNVTIGDHVCIFANSVLDDCVVGDHCEVGPFARLRPNTTLAHHAKVGNFVEIKKSNIGAGSKISHLSYIGDTEMGEAVNIGAGTITCNYDGANKHKTIIKDRVFVGSNTSLIAPVTLDTEATIGASSAISKDVAKKALALTRAKQITIDGWKRPKKQEK
jgi:bifunctional UDP-N-acetylglucosamine pyrophosphorylase / glucosamine-1-phosphate N-acetyltransferase